MPIREWLRRLWAPDESDQAESQQDDQELEAAPEDESEIDPFNPFTEPVTIEITDVIDLHTIAPREVKLVVEEYLRQAYDASFPSVRIIHGKGIGVQRELVR